VRTIKYIDKLIQMNIKSEKSSLVAMKGHAMANGGDPALFIEMNCQNIEKEPRGYDGAPLGFISSKPVQHY
jgi:hypothetical protein